MPFSEAFKNLKTLYFDNVNCIYHIKNKLSFQTSHSLKWNPGLIGKNQNKTIKFNFDMNMIDLKNYGPKSYNENIDVTFISNCKGQESKIPLKKPFSYRYKSKLIISHVADEHKIPFSKNSEPLQQIFKIKNEGPSKIKKKTAIKVFVPNDELLDEVSE